MAYTPKTWTCGETITDTGLNNIEQGIQEALAGGGNLPEVTSADDDKVLTVVNGEWAKADRGYKCDGDNVETTECFEKAVESLLGYECKETATLLTQESVTTAAEMGFIVGSLSYSQSISADTIRVTFDGTEYICDKTDTGLDMQYGDWNATTDKPVFSNYPFCIISSNLGNRFFTETAGTYNIKIEEYEASIETSECFETAVKSVVGDVDKGYSCTETVTELFTETFTYDNAPSNYTLDYSGEISAPKIKVTLNGTEYICDRTMSSGTARYGDSDLIAYPFALRSSLSLEGGYFNNRFKAPDNGDYTIKVEAFGTSAETSDCFDLAVKSVIENNPLETRGYKCTEDNRLITDEEITTAPYDGPGNKAIFLTFGEIDGNTLEVIFDGDYFKCEARYDTQRGGKVFGAPYNDSTGVFDWNDYPFHLWSYQDETALFTQNAGTYSIKLTRIESRSDVSDCFTKAVKKILSITDATILQSDGGLVAEPDYVVADLLNFALPVYIKEGDLQSMIFSSFQDGDGKWHFLVFDEYGTPREYITNNDGFPEWVSH